MFDPVDFAMPSSHLPADCLIGVFHAPGESMELRRVDLPQLAAGEMLVRVRCCTICGSDLHTIRGSRSAAGPTVLGHEIVGEIAALLDDSEVSDLEGTSLHIGDRVVWALVAACGGCPRCAAGFSQKCERLFKYGHEPTSRWVFSGGFAEFCHLTAETAIVRVPDTVPDNVASPASCATATSAAAVRVAGGCRGKAVCIHGAGMLGLTSAAMARAQGAIEVIVCDTSAERLALAQQFGATRLVHVDADPGTRFSIAGRSEDVADVVFDMSGAVSAIENSIDILKVGGRLVLVGSVFPTRPAKMLPEHIVRKLLRIEGVHNYLPRDLVTAMQFLAEFATEYPFGALVEMEFALRDLNEGIAKVLEKGPIRALCRAN